MTQAYTTTEEKKLDKENMGPWQMGKAESKHHNAEVLHCLFCLSHCHHGLLIGLCAQRQGSRSRSTHCDEGQAGDCLRGLNPNKPMGAEAAGQCSCSTLVYHV